MHNTNKPPEFKYLIMLSVLHATFMLCSIILINKKIMIGGLQGSAASLIIPLAFVTADIITEIYGYTYCKQVIWASLAAEFVFSLSAYALILLPSPSTWHNQEAFNLIIASLPRIAFSALIAFPIASLLNAKIIAKWKIILSGKHFWLRSIGSSIVAEFLFTFISIFIIFSGKISLATIFSISAFSISIKIIYSIILSGPANFLVMLLKKIENYDAHNNSLKFNPFKIRKN